MDFLIKANFFPKLPLHLFFQERFYFFYFSTSNIQIKTKISELKSILYFSFRCHWKILYLYLKYFVFEVFCIWSICLFDATGRGTEWKSMKQSQINLQNLICYFLQTHIGKEKIIKLLIIQVVLLMVLSTHIRGCLSVVHDFIQLSLNSNFAQVQTLLAARRRSLTMVPGRNKTKRLSSFNHTTKTIHVITKWEPVRQRSLIKINDLI